MENLKRLLCQHDYERQSVYVDTGELVKKCRKCGDRRRESTHDTSPSPSSTDADTATSL